MSTNSQMDCETSVEIENSSRKQDVITGPWGSNPEIAAPLVIANNKRLRRCLAFIVYPLIFSGIVGIILLIIYSQIDSAGLLILGIFLLTTFIIVAPALSCQYCWRRADSMHKEEHYAIRIEGDQWDRYLTYFFDKENRPKYFYSCMFVPEKRLNELRERGFGHVILSSSGFMIDEIYYISYGSFAVYNAKVLSTTNQNGIQDSILRLSITNRTHQAKHGPMPTIHADIFVPPQMSPDELINIIQFIHSHRGTITVIREV